MAGLEKIPVLIRDLSRRQIMEIALIENLQREGLNPMEEARGYARLMEEFHLTPEEAAARVGKSRPAVANTLRLLALPEQVQTMLEKGTLSAGHARAILGAGTEREQIELAEETAKKGLSVRETERRAKAARPARPAEKAGAQAFAGSFAREAALALTEKMGRSITVRPAKKGGVLMVPYFDDEDLRALTKKLGED